MAPISEAMRVAHPGAVRRLEAASPLEGGRLPAPRGLYRGLLASLVPVLVIWALGVALTLALLR